MPKERIGCWVTAWCLRVGRRGGEICGFASWRPDLFPGFIFGEAAGEGCQCCCRAGQEPRVQPFRYEACSGIISHTFVLFILHPVPTER
jgi:hypothetical protein